MDFWQIIKLPWSMLQVLSSRKSFADNPVLGSSWLNERGLHRTRCAIAARMATWRRRRLANRLDPADRRTLDEAGMLVKPNFLADDCFERLRAEICGQGWDTLEMRQGPALTRRSLLDPGILAQRAPNLARLLEDRRVIDLIRYASATGGRPLFSLQTIITHGVSAGEDPQTLPHSDTFHAAAKAWLFLHDVGPDAGPFFYVRGSHRRTPKRLCWEHRQSLTASQHPIAYHARGSFRATEADLDELGLDRPAPVCVAANTLVITDTSGFHGRTPSAEPNTRIEVYATLRRNPFLPWLGLHLMAMPPLRQFPGTLAVASTRALMHFGIRRPWSYVGKTHLGIPSDATDQISESGVIKSEAQQALAKAPGDRIKSSDPLAPARKD